MEKDYNYFHKILIEWFRGTITSNEILKMEDLPFKIDKLSQWSDFLSDFEQSFRNFNEDFFYQWSDYKEYAKDTAPSTNGLIHNIKELLSDRQTEEDFINWACLHNKDCGETTSGVFENNSIEYFCLFFLPYHYENLEFNFYSKAISIIKKSNEISYGEFVIAINLLLEKEKRSMYFFLKDYLDGKKSEDDLNIYLEKKFNINLPDFKFDLSVFPYTKILNKIKENGEDIDSLMSAMEK